MGKTRQLVTKQAKGNAGRSSIWLAVIVFALAAAVRGLYLYDSSDNPTFFTPIVDSLTYDQMAGDLVEGKPMTHEFFWQPLFYPLFVSLVYSLSGSCILCVKILQTILGALTCVLSYRLGEKVFGRAAGVAAGIITALYIPLIFWEGELLAVGWAAFWSVALVWVLIAASDKPSVWRGFVLGLCGILSIITRPVFLAFFAAACVWLVFTWLRRKVRARRLLFGVAGIAVGFLLVAGPVGILSRQVTGRVMILPYSGGVNLYIGNNPNYKQTITIRPGLGWRKLLEMPAKQGITNRWEKARFFTDKTIDYVVREPAGFLNGLAYKTTQFFSSREMPRNVDIYLFRKWSVLLQAGVWKASGFGFPFGPMLALAVVGLLYARRNTPPAIWLFAVLYPASVILVFVTSRYRTPVIPVLSVLAAAGCAALWKSLAQGQWRRLAILGLIAAGVGWAATAAGPFYAEQLNYEPELYYGLADSLDKRGHTDEAIEAYSKAVELRAAYVEARHNLALLLVKKQRLPEAMAQYDAALELDPENAGLHEDIGVALFRQGRTQDAIKHYQRAAEIKPDKASVYDNLGTAFLSLKRLDEAQRHYSKAVELDPDDPVSHNNLGNVFAMQRELDKAAEHYERSLAIQPADAEVLNNLANVFAGLGDLEKATEKYEQALRIAPNDAGIYVNLGLCLQRQGQTNRAAEAFRKALSINRKNKRAQQALQELPKTSVQPVR